MNALRYHLHPLTGMAKPCKARISCPFGDLTTDHYGSPQEAEAAFEKQQEEKILAVMSKVLPRSLEEAMTDCFQDKLSSVEDPIQRRLLLRGASLVGEEGLARDLALKSLLVTRDKYKALGRDDLAEVAEWSRKVLESNLNSRAAKEDSKRWRKQAEAAEEEIARLEALGDPWGEIPAQASWRAEFMAEAVKSDARLPAMEAYDRAALKRLSKQEFFLQGHVLEEPVTVYEGASEVVLLPQGEEVTVEEALGRQIYPGRASLAQEEALKKLEDHGSTLLRLLQEDVEAAYEGEDLQPFPEYPEALSDGNLRGQDFRTVADEYFKPREGFRLLGAGVENSVYLHEPTQMVYKVPHEQAEMLWTLPEEKRLPALKRGVQLLEDKYVALEGAREALNSLGAEYTPTYFVGARTVRGDLLPVVVQPYLEQELYAPFEPRGKTTPGGESFDQAFRRMGFSDVHEGNISYNLRTGKIVLFDCMFIGGGAYQEDFVRQGLVSPQELEVIAPLHGGSWREK